MPRTRVNGTELYYEIRGTGAPVLLIMGASGDGGHFDAIADLLSDEFTVVTYDRRGNGRSPAPTNWKTTSPEEQADDAAGLLTALVPSPAVVCGTSSGAAFALCLLARHPAALRGAILHEPALFAFLDDPDAARAPLRARIRSAMETGGPQTATEPWWRYVARYVAGEDAWNKLAPDLRDRMRASSDTLFRNHHRTRLVGAMLAQAVVHMQRAVMLNPDSAAWRQELAALRIGLSSPENWQPDPSLVRSR